MKSVTMILFLISFLLFLGTIRYLLAIKRPGVFPPKQVLKKRASALAGGGGIFLVAAILLSNF
ncbi:hypothetical protein [Neobacillus sp. FSL H8-0543]|uniref:hypothetical protein n=1 Tax=Neobacillus sp. FSL H8-0543 TaxID=2954672 RepID=UPI003158E072